MINATTKVFKFLEHNPFVTVAAVLAIAISLLGPVGCQGKVASPFSGEQATADVIKHEAEVVLRNIGEERRVISAGIDAGIVALGALDDDEDDTLDRANVAIAGANAETERRGALGKMLLDAFMMSTPMGPLGPILSPLLLGGLGLDRVRTGLVVRKKDKEINALKNPPGPTSDPQL